MFKLRQRAPNVNVTLVTQVEVDSTLGCVTSWDTESNIAGKRWLADIAEESADAAIESHI
jgi:hypothetical protein